MSGTDRRVIVAGVGNIFRSDDGFGSAVVRWLQEHEAAQWEPWITVQDFGIRGVHLAYELLDGYAEVIIVDTMHRDGDPGTLYVVEPDLARLGASRASMVDAHDMAPESVLAMVPALGGTLGHVSVVGCEPASLQDGIGLSDVVADQVPGAARLVCGLLDAVRRGSATSPAPVR